MPVIEWIILGLFYIIGIILCMAAFAKVHKSSKTYTNDEDRIGAIVGSLFLWPICLLVCVCIIVYRKVYDR